MPYSSGFLKLRTVFDYEGYQQKLQRLEAELSDESVWQDWIDTKMPIVEKAIRNLGGEGIQPVSPSRARLEELRSKYGRR